MEAITGISNAKLRRDHGYTEVDFIACALEVGPWLPESYNEYWDKVTEWFKHHYPEQVCTDESANGYWIGEREFQYAMYVWNKGTESKPLATEIY